MVIPPEKDFGDFSKLMSLQQGSFGELSRWASGQCNEVSDLTGLLAVVPPLVNKVSGAFAGELTKCANGMGDVGGKASQAGKTYYDTERKNHQRAQSIWPDAVPGFPDIGEVQGLQHLGDFNNEDVKLDAPDPAGDDTAKQIKHQLLLLNHNGSQSGKILHDADSIYHYVTGQSLVQQLLTPIFGNYGRLKFLQEAYKSLADGIYTVTGTVRKGPAQSCHGRDAHHSGRSWSRQ